MLKQIWVWFFSPCLKSPREEEITRNRKVLFRPLCPHYFIHRSSGPLPADKLHASLPRNDWQLTLSARPDWANWHSQSEYENGVRESLPYLLMYLFNFLTFMFFCITVALDCHKNYACKMLFSHVFKSFLYNTPKVSNYSLNFYSIWFYQAE